MREGGGEFFEKTFSGFDRINQFRPGDGRSAGRQWHSNGEALCTSVRIDSCLGCKGGVHAIVETYLLLRQTLANGFDSFSASLRLDADAEMYRLSLGSCRPVSRGGGLAGVVAL